MNQSLTNLPLPGLAHLSDFGCIEIKGPDSVRFLQGQITTNAENISTIFLSLSAMCNPQGRCVALFFIGKIDDSVILILSRETIEQALANIKKYAVFFKIEINDISDQKQVFGLAAEATSEAVKIPSSVGHEFRIEQLNQPENQIFSFYLVSEKYQSDFDAAVVNFRKCKQGDWLYWLNKNRIPWLDINSQNEFLPHNLNLPELGAVDFNKGCFTGQEVIARMQYKGSLKSHMQLLQTQEPVTVISKSKLWLGDKTVGEVICAAANDENVSILALIKDNYLENKIFRLNNENGPILELISKI
ncbi:YgfZ/GcvT domain-containing protein [Aliikangiella maris]|uniref:Uncharacterized protein n=2 Tax=Aliikangiella maris TaxID=3162458 RepID=A0ABV3ML00_9GAMM